MAFLSHTEEYGSSFISHSNEFRLEDGQLLVLHINLIYKENKFQDS